MADKEELFDCIISAGELDDSGNLFLDNDLRVLETAKRGVTYIQFKEWELSPEYWKRKRELERIGRARFGEQYWMKYQVCHYCTVHKGV